MGEITENTDFRNIAIALAFSPRAEALLHEVQIIRARYNATLTLIHAGAKRPEEEKKLDGLLKATGMENEQYNVIWEEGKPEDVIIDQVERQQVDLLILGALRRENLFHHYVGSIARKVCRRIRSSVLLIIEPQKEGQHFDRVVIKNSENRNARATLSTGVDFAVKNNARKVTVVEEMPAGKTNFSGKQGPGNKKGNMKDNGKNQTVDQAEKIMERFQASTDTIELQQKRIYGKPGYSIGHYAEANQADLLVINGPERRLNLFDRVFTHGIEHILSTIPTNLLIVNSR